MTKDPRLALLEMANQPDEWELLAQAVVFAVHQDLEQRLLLAVRIADAVRATAGTEAANVFKEHFKEIMLKTTEMRFGKL